MKVSVDTSILKSECSKMSGNIEDLSKAVNRISQKASSTENWEGTDQQHFNNKMNEFINELYKFQVSLDSYREFVNNYVDALENLDNDYSGRTINLR